MSGSALSSWAMASDPVATTSQLASAVSCPLTEVESGNIYTSRLVRCLRNATYSQLMNADVPTADVSGIDLVSLDLLYM